MIAANYSHVLSTIADAARASGRSPSDVRALLAVKTVPVPRIEEALDAGAYLLGHNRAQELSATAPEITQAHEMHFIGHLQTNKAKVVSELASCVQSVNSLRLAQRLSNVSAQREKPLQVMVQVNTSGEETKSGIEPEQTLELVHQVSQMPHLQLTGLMCIGAHSTDEGKVSASYLHLAQLRQECQEAGFAQVKELSMGMSTDYPLAIAQGATIVRIGTAVFGARE